MKREVTITVDLLVSVNPAMAWVRDMLEKGLRGGPVMIALSRPRRTLDQNAKLWPMLTDISRQVDWYGQRLTPDEWKHVFTAALRKQKTVPGIDGGFVVLGLSTSKMDKGLFSELIELMYAFGDEREVKWSKKSREAFEQVRNV